MWKRIVDSLLPTDFDSRVLLVLSSEFSNKFIFHQSEILKKAWKVHRWCFYRTLEFMMLKEKIEMKKFTSNCWSWYNASINWNLVTIFGSTIHSVMLQKEESYNFLFYFHPVPLFSHPNNFSLGGRKKNLEPREPNGKRTCYSRIFFSLSEEKQTKYGWDETRICDSWKNFFLAFLFFAPLS